MNKDIQPEAENNPSSPNRLNLLKRLSKPIGVLAVSFLALGVGVNHTENEKPNADKNVAEHVEVVDDQPDIPTEIAPSARVYRDANTDVEIGDAIRVYSNEPASNVSDINKVDTSTPVAPPPAPTSN